MAIEKVLNTRIQLKYDSYTNWTNQNPVLKSGEIAIAYLANSHTTTTPDNNTHAVMFKVGPGNFNSLPWASALAADVYAWAKQSEADFVKNFLAMKDGDGASIQAKLDALFVTPAEMEKALEDLEAALTGADGLAGAVARIDAIEKSMATDAELAAAIAQEVADRNKAISDESALRVAAEEALGKRIDAEALARENADKALQDQINAIDFIDANELATALNPYAKTADVAATYETIANADLIRNRVKDLEDHKDDYKAYADQAEADAIAAAKTETEGQVKALSDSIKNHESVDSFADVMTEMAKYQLAGDYATKAEAQAMADGKDASIKAAKDSADAANAKIDAFMSDDAQVQGAIDTLVEINKYITDDTAAFTALSGRVDKLEDGTVAAKEAEHADVASKLDDAGIAQVKGIKVDDAAHADIASGLDATGVAQVEKIKVENAGHADTATNADKAADADKLGGAAAADYLKKADAPGYDDILTKTAAQAAYQPKGEYATAAQGAKADTAVQPDALNSYYTKSEADAAFMDSTETGNAIDAKITALNLATTYEPIGAETRAKAYADGLAGNYATAAQGAKADSALQEITTTANGGLKVTNKNQIDIDENVVFVFNCGSASVLVD
jgi:hypothetical protein